MQLGFLGIGFFAFQLWVYHVLVTMYEYHILGTIWGFAIVLAECAQLYDKWGHSTNTVVTHHMEPKNAVIKHSHQSISIGFVFAFLRTELSLEVYFRNLSTVPLLKTNVVRLLWGHHTRLVTLALWVKVTQGLRLTIILVTTTDMSC